MATFISNRTPTTSYKGIMSPFKAMWGQKPNLHNLPLFKCKSQVHVPDTLRRKLDPKAKECIFLGYAEGVKGGVFKHVATGQRFVSHDSVVGNVRLNFEPIARGSPTHQGKDRVTKVSSVQSEDNLYETQSLSPTTKGSSTYSNDYYDDLLMEYEEMPIRRPRQPPVRFIHKWALTPQVEDELEPLTVTKASRSVHWREAIERNTNPSSTATPKNSFPYPRTEP